MEQALTLLGIGGMAFVVGLSGAMMPGPLLAVTIRESARRGAKAGPLLMVGHAILEAALVIAIVLGFGAVLKRPATIGAISLVGGVMMGWMGVDMLRSLGRPNPVLSDDTGTGMHPVAAGVLVSLSNPYWTIWWATVGLGYLVMGLRHGWAGIAAFFVGHIAADCSWYCLVSVGVARGRQFLSDRWYGRLIAGCGVVVVGFGAWFVWTGVSVWR